MSTVEYEEETPPQDEDDTRPAKRPKKTEEATTHGEKAKVVVLAHLNKGDMPFLHWSVIPRAVFDPKYLNALELASSDAKGDGKDAQFAFSLVEDDIFAYQERGEEMSLHELFRRMRRGDYEAEFFWYEEYRSNREEEADLERLSDVNDLAKGLLDWACTELGIAAMDDEMFKEENEMERIHRTSVLFAAACELLWEREQLDDGRAGVVNHWRTKEKEKKD